MSTESALREWRYGQTQAERLVAALLHLEFFESVDPQHPLGGPDGLKDVLCRRDRLTWIAAAYFPPTAPTFADIKRKFIDDFAGVAANSADAFAFFVNQPLTIGEREELLKLASPTTAEIYHLERIRALLDAPKGCGIRLEYLRIPMTEEEQWAFWSSMNQDLVRRLVDHEARRSAQLDSMDAKIELLLRRTAAIEFDLLSKQSHLVAARPAEEIEMPTATLSIGMLCWLHRVITESDDRPEAIRGKLRGVTVWIQSATTKEPVHTPPPPEELPRLLSDLIDWWTARHRALRGASKTEIVSALAELYHRFLWIHPFLDANGRIARTLLDEAARELLNQSIGPEFEGDRHAYYNALMAADRGQLEELQARIAAALT